MPTVTQVNNTTWIIFYRGFVFTVDKYYDSGFVIRYREGIYNTIDDIISELIRFN